MDDSENLNSENAGYLDQLVGEGKKYRSVEELAKGYVNADTFIESLKANNDDLKQEVEKRMAIEEFIKTKQDNQNTETPAQADPTPGSTEVNTPTEPAKEAEPKVNESELIERVKAALRNEDAQATAEQNTTAVVNRLKEVFGDEAKINEAIGEKANEIGVDVRFLQDMAAKSPKGFYSLLGIDGGQKPSGKSPEPAVNTAGLKPSEDSYKPQPGTKAFYDDLRKKDLKQFLSPRVQSQYMKDAAADPNKFFGRNS